MRKKNGVGSVLVLLLVSAALQTITIISIMLSGIASAFPDKSDTTVQMLYSIAIGAGVVGTLAAGKAANIITKKKFLSFCLAANIVGGVIGYCFHGSFSMLILASVFIGFGTGSLPTLTTAIMAEYFEGEQRARILSFQGVAVAGGGIVFSALAGMVYI